MNKKVLYAFTLLAGASLTLPSMAMNSDNNNESSGTVSTLKKKFEQQTNTNKAASKGSISTSGQSKKAAENTLNLDKKKFENLKKNMHATLTKTQNPIVDNK